MFVCAFSCEYVLHIIRVLVEVFEVCSAQYPTPTSEMILERCLFGLALVKQKR